MTELVNIGVMYPPAMREMLLMPQTGGAYDQQGRYCAPPAQVDAYAVSENVKLLSQHQGQQKIEFDQLKNALIDKFEGLDRTIKDAMAFMYYTMQYHPNVVHEFKTAQKAKVRIGVGDTPVPGVQGT